MSASRRHSPVRVGRVVANTGRDILVLVDKNADKRPALRIGDVVLTAGQTDPSVGVISGVNAPAPGLEGDGDDLWVVQVELLGSFHQDGGPVFTRGVAVPPALGAIVHLATADDLARLNRNDDEAALPIGDVQGEMQVKATADPDRLLDGGFAVLGAAGTGKSASLACVMRALLRARHPVNALLIDPYNEFGTSFGRAARVIEPRPGLFPHWLLTIEELVWVLTFTGGALDADERSVLEEAIPVARRSFLQRSGQAPMAEGVSVDAPIPYRITDIIGFIDKLPFGDGERPAASRARLRTRIMSAIGDPRLSIFFGTAATTDNLGALLVDLFRLDALPPLSVLQVGRLSSGLDKIVVAIVCRLAAALAEWSGVNRQTLILMDNAERYAPAETSDVATQLSRDAIRTLGGRPRKLGTALGLTAASPRVLDRDVLGRCGTLFLHRMPSVLDADAVEEILAEPAPGGIDGLAALQQREVMAVGQGISFGGRVLMSELPAVAIPGTRPLTNEAIDLGEEISSTVDRWRRFGTGELPPADSAA